MNHLVNANKKVVSKTPRTDRQAYITWDFKEFVKAGFARQLERQLAGANKRVNELEENVKAYKVRLIEDGEYIYTLGTMSDRYRMALLKARERIKELEAKQDELNDLKKWLEGR
jgi:BMFP domain-containing protein YqiC